MKRLFLLSGSLLILFLMTACGGGAEPAATSSESDTQDTAEVVVEAPEEEAVEAVAEEAVEIVEEVVEEEPEVEVVEETVKEAVVEEEVAEEAMVEEPQEEVAEADSAVEEAVVVGPTDFELIGQTGRPQFINSYATWWSTWRANAPVVNGLKGTFQGRVDFFDLNIDDPAIDALRNELQINNRSHYILLAPDGETVLRQWFGPLNSSMNEQVTAILEENGY